MQVDIFFELLISQVLDLELGLYFSQVLLPAVFLYRVDRSYLDLLWVRWVLVLIYTSLG